MRNGLSTTQQTLSPEAAAVLCRSAAEAARRRHSQTTPLHVAAALLSSSAVLRRALAAAASAAPSPSLHSRPHPRHCRALELCFSVALDRLPSSNHGPSRSPAEPPMSNALAAALKRAQANHRRGAPAAAAAADHHRAPHPPPLPPLLAARVEVEQLLLSVLDDPSVGRVMREASLSSAAVKSAVEQTLASSSPSSPPPPPPPPPSSNPYLSPRFRESQTAGAGASRKKCFSEKSEAQQGLLPPWLQLAMLGNDRSQPEEKALARKQRSEELRMKWTDKCFLLHPNFQSALLDSSEKPSYPPSLSPFKPNSTTLSKSITPFEISKTCERSSTRPKSPPGSPVKTELALGPSKPCNFSEKPRTELLEHSSDQPDSKICAISDTDFFKKLLKGLLEEVTWQPHAASTIAAVITQRKCRGGRRRPLGPEGDTWLLFLGPDKVGERKMATALSELMFGTRPITISFSDRSLEEEQEAEEDIYRESNTNLWGKTVIDRVGDAIRRNPFSVITIEDFDRADSLFRLNIKRAMEMGRLTDSHGREIGLGSAIFILASNWLPPDTFNGSQDSLIHCEEKILNSATRNWQLEFSIVNNPAKRRADWLHDGDRALKLRKGSLGLPFDLNLAAEAEDEAHEGSRNSSDVTAEREFEKGRLAVKCSTKSSPSDLMGLADAAIVFNPIDFGPLKRKVLDCISERFKAKMGDGYTIRVDDDAVDRIVANIWLKEATLEEWTRSVLYPSIENLKDKLDDAQGHKAVVRLSTVRVRVRDRTAQKRCGGRDQIPIAIDTL